MIILASTQTPSHPLPIYQATSKLYPTCTHTHYRYHTCRYQQIRREIPADKTERSVRVPRTRSGMSVRSGGGHTGAVHGDPQVPGRTASDGVVRPVRFGGDQENGYRPIRPLRRPSAERVPSG